MLYYVATWCGGGRPVCETISSTYRIPLSSCVDVTSCSHSAPRQACFPTLQHGTTRCNTTAPRVATRRHLDHALPRAPLRDRPAHAHAPKRQARATANPTKPDPHARRTVRWMERRHRAERATCDTTCVGVLSPKPVAASHNSRLLTGALVAAAHSGVRGATKSGRARTARKDHAAPHTCTGACAHTRMHTHSSPH